MHAFIFAVVGGAIVLLGKWLFAAMLREISTRLSVTLWGIRFFHHMTPYLRDQSWSGKWQLTWKVQSTNFPEVNTDLVKIYRIFGDVAMTAVFHPSETRTAIEYFFVGRLNKDRTILTGTWVDRKDRIKGYHGGFQVRLKRTGELINGLWIGFSDEEAIVKCGPLSMQKIRRETGFLRTKFIALEKGVDAAQTTDGK